MKTHKISEFNLDEFTTAPPQLTPVVQVPQKDFFRVIENRQLEGKFFNLVTHNEWWLVTDNVLAECEEHGLRINNLWKAELFHGIYSNGRNTLIPATSPLVGKEFWRETLQEAIDAARERWIKLERTNAGYDFNSAKHELLDEDEWHVLTTSELLNGAFDGRIITTFKQAEKYLPLISTQELDDDLNFQVVGFKRPQKKFKN